MISHKHKVIFVHVPKTGGQSIEQMFLDDLGLSWAERAPLLLRQNDDPAAGPRRLAHLYADEYVGKGHVTQEQFDSYLTFAVVRNPYQRIVSEYFFRFRKTPFWKRPTPEAFVETQFESDFQDFARHLMPQARYVQDANGKMLVDRIIHFENIREEVEALAPQIFGEPRSLPHRNKSRRKSSTAKDKTLARIKTAIAERYAEDFDLFGYTR